MAPAGSRKLSYELDIPAAQLWTDTGIALVPGDKLTITAAGSVQSLQSPAVGPEGVQRSWRDLLRALPVNAAGGGALIGRIGADPAAVPFLVGSSKELHVTIPGHLFLGINKAEGEDAQGTFHVKLNIQPATAASAAEARSAINFDTNLLAQVPRRVKDAAGNAGDVVNFLLVGSQQQVQAAFQQAGWVLVDRDKAQAVLHAILSSTSKQSYVEMPMSELYLFGRVQDFGYARAEPVQVVATRHHLRLWKAPFQLNGQTVWAGAATHDVGFEKDQRTGGVTHKIDPNIDLERDFVGQCFQQAGATSGLNYLIPADPVRDAHTATGGSFQTDGRVLVIVLNP